jgi:hypothetical protein
MLDLQRKPLNNPDLRRPPLAALVDYQRAWFVQTTGMDASITAATKEAIANEYRWAAYPDAVTQAARLLKWARAVPFQLPTGLYLEADALSLATIIDGLLGRVPYQVTTPFDARILQLTELGNTVAIKTDRYGMSSGASFVLVRQLIDGPNQQLQFDLY